MRYLVGGLWLLGCAGLGGGAFLLAGNGLVMMGAGGGLVFGVAIPVGVASGVAAFAAGRAYGLRRFRACPHCASYGYVEATVCPYCRRSTANPVMGAGAPRA